MPFTVTRDLILPSTVTGFVAASALVRHQHVGQAARHLHARRPLPREVRGRPRGRRSATRSAPASTSSPTATSTATRISPAAAGITIRCSDGPASRAISLQSEATRSPWLRYPPGTLLNEIYTGVALAAGHRQDRASSARLPEDLAHRPEQVAQAGALRHLLLAGHGPVPRHPHRQVQGQPRSRLGHGGGDEHGAARAARRRLPLHPDRRADAPLHGQHLRRRRTRR